MLTGLTVALPRAMPVIASRPGEVGGMPAASLPASAGGMPIALAMSRIFCGPFSIASVMSMKAEFADFWVA